MHRVCQASTPKAPNLTRQQHATTCLSWILTEGRSFLRKSQCPAHPQVDVLALDDGAVREPPLHGRLVQDHGVLHVVPCSFYRRSAAALVSHTVEQRRCFPPAQALQHAGCMCALHTDGTRANRTNLCRPARRRWRWCRWGTRPWRTCRSCRCARWASGACAAGTACRPSGAATPAVHMSYIAHRRQLLSHKTCQPLSAWPRSAWPRTVGKLNG